jgi:hypothetical protein
VRGDKRPFAHVVRSRPTPTLMVPLRQYREWGRSGFGAGRGGRYGGQTSHQGFAWHCQGFVE